MNKVRKICLISHAQGEKKQFINSSREHEQTSIWPPFNHSEKLPLCFFFHCSPESVCPQPTAPLLGIWKTTNRSFFCPFPKISGMVIGFHCQVCLTKLWEKRTYLCILVNHTHSVTHTEEMGSLGFCLPPKYFMEVVSSCSTTISVVAN